MADAISENRYELRFRLTEQDYAAYWYTDEKTLSERVYSALTPAAYWALVALFALPVLFYPPLRQAVMNQAGFYGPPLLVALFGLILFIFHRRILLPAVVRDFISGYGLSDEAHIVAADAGMNYEVNGIKTDIPWSAIQRVTRRYGCIFLSTSRKNAIVLPERAFATPEEAERFLSFAQRRAGKKS